MRISRIDRNHQPEKIENSMHGSDIELTPNEVFTFKRTYQLGWLLLLKKKRIEIKGNSDGQ